MISKSRTPAGRREGVVPPAAFTLAPSLQLRRDGDRPLAEQRWENEGGHLRRLAAANRLAAAAGAMGDGESLTAQVSRMADGLSSDFAHGRVGMHHNTYGHRSRVLRQLTAKRDALPAPEAQEDGR